MQTGEPPLIQSPIRDEIDTVLQDFYPSQYTTELWTLTSSLEALCLVINSIYHASLSVILPIFYCWIYYGFKYNLRICQPYLNIIVITLF